MVLGAAAGFGTIGIFGELAAAVDLGFVTLLSFRFGVATALVLAVAAVRGWSIPQSGRNWAAMSGLGAVYAAMTLLFFVSLRSLTAGLATIVLYTYPVFVIALSVVFLQEGITIRKAIALGLAMTGIVLIVGTNTAGATLVGVGFALAAAACYAVYTVGSRTLVRTVMPRTLMAGVLVGTAISTVAYGILSGQLSVPVGEREWGIVLGLAIVGTVLPLFLFYRGVARLEASRVGIVSTAEPAVTVTLGALVLGEPVTPTVVIGGALVLGGVLLVQRRGTEQRCADVSPATREGYRQ
jgi:drug/metabolite transporter (DMT)-like permease